MAKKLLHGLILTLVLTAKNATASVILQYHHVSESLPTITSVSPAQFKTHLEYLKVEQFNVLPLDTMLLAIKNGKPLPKKSVAITFDDGYNNNIEQAAPLLEAFKFPYTVFVNPKLIDSKQSYVMTWQQLKHLSMRGALIASHSAEHDYLHLRRPNESHKQWYDRVKTDLLWSEQRIKEEIGHNAKMIAYPYGEFNKALQSLIKEIGFVGIGQHSGAVGANTDLTRVPRFPASGIYADLSTLKTKLNAHPFAIEALSYTDTVLTESKPSITINFKSITFDKAQFHCFVSGQGQADIKWVSDTQVRIIAKESLPKGRTRYNCTAPVNDLPGEFYWFSQPWVITD